MRSSQEVVAALGPRVGAIAEVVGRRADDEAVVKLVSEELGKKPPASTTDNNDSKYVAAKTKGIACLFTHRVVRESHPPIRKGRSYVPYLSVVWLREKFDEPLPFGITHSASEDELRELLGPETGRRGVREDAYWDLWIDEDRGVVLRVEAGSVTVEVDTARVLQDFGPPATVGIFITWCARRDLLDRDALSAHLALINSIRSGTEWGTALYTLLDRGLWDSHLRKIPGLRDRAYSYFHRLDDDFISTDLVELFGARDGDDVPDLDAESEEAVTRASAVFDERFRAVLAKR